MRFTAAFLALILAAGPAAAQGSQYTSQNIPNAPAHNLQGYPEPYSGAAYSRTRPPSPAEEVKEDIINSPENLAILRGGTAAQGAMQGYHR
jgi:hypothetical protein